MDKQTEALLTTEKNRNAGSRVFMGVGNSLSGDDGVGPAIAALLADSTWTAFDCGTAPEHFTGKVRQLAPSLVVIADAAVMGTPPGSVRRIPLDRVRGAGFTTHAIPLSLLAQFIQADGPQVILLGIEPTTLEPADSLSDPVRAAAAAIAAALVAGRMEEFPVLEA